MTNKRITELTALDGDDVANDDVLVIVDVSDTTMAASGTNKKITVAELVTDSALTGAFWPNSSTALTGSNLANGDKLAVVDVGSPDVAKYITADELAQGSQFTSRYLDGSKIFLTAAQFGAIVGSPGLGTLGNASANNRRTAVWLLDSATSEAVAASFLQPVNWATFDIYFWWSNAGAGAGDVNVNVGFVSFADGETTDSVSSSTGITTAPAQYIAKRTKGNLFGALTATPGEIGHIRVTRAGADVADTLGNDMGLIGVELVRVS